MKYVEVSAISVKKEVIDKFVSTLTPEEIKFIKYINKCLDKVYMPAKYIDEGNGVKLPLINDLYKELKLAKNKPLMTKLIKAISYEKSSVKYGHLYYVATVAQRVKLKKILDTKLIPNVTNLLALINEFSYLPASRVKMRGTKANELQALLKKDKITFSITRCRPGEKGEFKWILHCTKQQFDNICHELEAGSKDGILFFNEGKFNLTLDKIKYNKKANTVTFISNIYQYYNI